MLVSLDCPTADVSARDLGVAFDGPLPEILVERTYIASETELQLGIIGASHVATVSFPGGTFREEISCFAGELGSLMSQERGSYSLQTSTQRYPDFENQATQILELVAGKEWLCANFPGEGEFHITAVRGSFKESTWEWETFHLYPEEQIIVSTTSRYKI